LKLLLFRKHCRWISTSVTAVHGFHTLQALPVLMDSLAAAGACPDDAWLSAMAGEQADHAFE
jgi:hypothetical protein